MLQTVLDRLVSKLGCVEADLKIANGNRKYFEDVKESIIKKHKELLHVEDKIKNELVWCEHELVMYEDEIAKRYNDGIITHEELEIESGYTSDDTIFYYGGRLPSLISNIQSKIIKKERSPGGFLISDRNAVLNLK